MKVGERFVGAEHTPTATPRLRFLAFMESRGPMLQEIYNKT
jgi:hypothetical protein